MALLPADSIKVIAESLGIPNLSDEIAKALAPDIEYRLREISQESLKFMRHAKREVLTTDDVNAALRLRNVEALYGFTANSDPLNFVRAVGTNDLYFIDDKEIDFNEVVGASLPACPRDVSLQLHWLAIEGVQPAIPQNPSTDTVAKKRKPATPLEKNPEIKPIVKHVISRELQLYYERITEAIKGDDKEVRDAALGSLSNDPGLHQLVPYFCQFISDEVTKNLRKTRVLLSLMQMIKALLDSPHIHIEPYLHQLMPSILTCLVGKRLSESDKQRAALPEGTVPDPTTHWELRDYAATLVAHVCKTFGEAYSTLQPRITKTLVHAWLDTAKPLPTHYGAIRGLTGLGRHTIQLLILPNLPPYWKLLVPERVSADPARQLDAKKASDALLQAAVVVIRAAQEDAKTPAGAKRDTPALPAAAAPLLGTNDPARLYQELRDMIGPDLDVALKESAQRDAK